MHHEAEYQVVRDRMKPGDLIAFAGIGFVSRSIKIFTRSVVSHVGVIFELHENGNRRVKLMESTTLHGVAGVQETFLSERVRTYLGMVWWLKLSDDIRRGMLEDHFWVSLNAQKGKKYDYRQVLRYAWDILHLFGQGEDWRKVYCSELVTIAYKSSFVLPVWINASQVRPTDLCRFKIWDSEYYQLSGPRTEIKKFNTIDPNTWKNK